MMGCKCLDCEAEAPVITVDTTPLLESPAFHAPAIPRTLTGLRVDRELAAGDELTAIVKDAAGQILGYIAQSEVDRYNSLPSAREIQEMEEAIAGMMDQRSYQNLSLPTVKMPKPTPLWDELMGPYIDEMARRVDAGLIKAYSFGRDYEAPRPEIIDEMPAESLSAVALLREHYGRQAEWIRRPDRIEVRP